MVSKCQRPQNNPRHCNEETDIHMTANIQSKKSSQLFLPQKNDYKLAKKLRTKSQDEGPHTMGTT